MKNSSQLLSDDILAIGRLLWKTLYLTIYIFKRRIGDSRKDSFYYWLKIHTRSYGESQTYIMLYGLIYRFEIELTTMITNYQPISNLSRYFCNFYSNK